MRRLEDCSDQELLLIMAIAALAKQLPYEIAAYTRVFGEASQRYFKGHGDKRQRRDLNPSPGSVAIVRRK